MSLSVRRRITLDAVARVTRIGRAEPQARRVRGGALYDLLDEIMLLRNELIRERARADELDEAVGRLVEELGAGKGGG
jgi:hypothetical protein